MEETGERRKHRKTKSVSRLTDRFEDLIEQQTEEVEAAKEANEFLEPVLTRPRAESHRTSVMKAAAEAKVNNMKSMFEKIAQTEEESLSEEQRRKLTETRLTRTSSMQRLVHERRAQKAAERAERAREREERRARRRAEREARRARGLTVESSEDEGDSAISEEEDAIVVEPRSGSELRPTRARGGSESRPSPAALPLPAPPTEVHLRKVSLDNRSDNPSDDQSVKDAVDTKDGVEEAASVNDVQSAKPAPISYVPEDPVVAEPAASEALEESAATEPVELEAQLPVPSSDHDDGASNEVKAAASEINGVISPEENPEPEAEPYDREHSAEDGPAADEPKLAHDRKTDSPTSEHSEQGPQASSPGSNSKPKNTRGSISLSSTNGGASPQSSGSKGSKKRRGVKPRSYQVNLSTAKRAQMRAAQKRVQDRSESSSSLPTRHKSVPRFKASKTEPNLHLSGARTARGRRPHATRRRAKAKPIEHRPWSNYFSSEKSLSKLDIR